VASIKQEETPIASVDITEVDINSIKVGQKVLMTLSSIEGQTFEGKVTGIDKIGSSESGVSNYPVIIKFDTDSELVLPNMSVDAEIVIAQKENALYVPTSAIKTVNDKKTVNTVKNGSSQSTEIQTGIVAGVNTEVISGLSEGDTILVDTLPTSGFTSTSTSQQRNSGIPGLGGGIGR
jgi:HlyD family secretion protein